MPELLVEGHRINYQDYGEGIPVVLTPGGRWAGYVQRVVATELAKDFRVITWDRPNTDGKSSVVIAGDATEPDMWADKLAGLIQGLNLGPCYVGEYAGGRITPLLCLKYPDLVKGLLLCWPSGGEVAAERVPRNLYRIHIRAALRGGMEGVADPSNFTEANRHFVDTAALNKANREALLAMDPLQFIRQLAYWEVCFTTTTDLPVAGCRATEEEWASITVPASVTGGCDPIHPTEVAHRLHQLLPNSIYHEPVVTPEEWANIFNIRPYPITSDFQGQRIAPVWREFVKQIEQ